MTTSSGTNAVLEVRELAKAFGATRALVACDLEVLPGEVHAVVGENGSGKSTLVKILAGVHRPDAGTVEIDGRQIGGLLSPRRSLTAGIATVFQEILVAGQRSVLENVWLGAEGMFHSPVSRDLKISRARAVLGELLGEPPALDQPAEELSISGRQACCVARALLRDPRILILDEATSALDIATRNRLFAALARFAATGRSVIFISHRMDEIEEIGDRVTVMRSGVTVATLPRGSAGSSELVRLMTGSEQLSGDAAAQAAEPRRYGPTVLRAAQLTLGQGARPLDFELHSGEIVGVGGLEGQGQDAFLHALRGSGGRSGRVELCTNEAVTEITSPRAAARHGIAYVPRERRAEALFDTMSVRDNFAVATLRQDAHGGLVSRSATEQRLRHYVEALRIVLGAGRDPITTLSGGNQQKVVMARWLAASPRILLLNDPTRGVDLGAKRDLYQLLVGLARDGVAIVMVSSEVDELVEVTDRVLIFRDQTVSSELERGAMSRESLIAGFFGEEPRQ